KSWSRPADTTCKSWSRPADTTCSPPKSTINSHPQHSHPIHQWIEDKAFSSTKGWAPVIGPFFHRGIMLLDFDEHRDHRRIMQQAFTRSALDGYLDLMRPGIVRTVTSWPSAQRFPFYPSVKRLLLDQSAEVFVGAQIGAESEQLAADFHATVCGGQAIVRADVPGGAWARGLRARERLERYFGDQLPARRAGDGTDLFSMLCRSRDEDGERFTDADIVNHMIFLLMAAHDTSAIALSMLVYELARNPQWQHHLRDEVLDNADDEIDIDSLARYPVLDAAVKEILRMYAPAGTLFRQAVKDTEVVGHYIPRNTQVAINVYGSMRLADWWPNPDRFDPGRFLAGADASAVHRYAFAPFGGGVHKCIGQHFADMNVKKIMHQLLRHHEWRVPDSYRMQLTWGTGPTPADGLPITLRRRGV
ncbi:cytochrome P450, partial [Mycolicibacterium chitae]